MTEYETSSGYLVEETMDGLDVSLNGQFKCELSGKTLADYSYEDEDDEEEFEVDDRKLEEDIELELNY